MSWQVLEIKDFEYTKARPFYLRTERLGIELCLEPCFNGYDVGLYREGVLLEEKICTNTGGVDLVAAISFQTAETLQDPSASALPKAVELANQLLLDYFCAGRVLLNPVAGWQGTILLQSLAGLTVLPNAPGSARVLVAWTDPIVIPAG